MLEIKTKFQILWVDNMKLNRGKKKTPTEKIHSKDAACV